MEQSSASDSQPPIDICVPFRQAVIVCQLAKSINGHPCSITVDTGSVVRLDVLKAEELELIRSAKTASGQ